MKQLYYYKVETWMEEEEVDEVDWWRSRKDKKCLTNKLKYLEIPSPKRRRWSGRKG